MCRKFDKERVYDEELCSLNIRVRQNLIWRSTCAFVKWMATGIAQGTAADAHAFVPDKVCKATDREGDTSHFPQIPSIEHTHQPCITRTFIVTKIPHVHTPTHPHIQEKNKHKNDGDTSGLELAIQYKKHIFFQKHIS